jgi:hypothetical protein
LQEGFRSLERVAPPLEDKYASFDENSKQPGTEGSLGPELPDLLDLRECGAAAVVDSSFYFVPLPK